MCGKVVNCAGEGGVPIKMKKKSTDFRLSETFLLKAGGAEKQNKKKSECGRAI